MLRRKQSTEIADKAEVNLQLFFGQGRPLWVKDTENDLIPKSQEV